MKYSVNLLIPACGDSTRFPGQRPKFLLTHPFGRSMLACSVSGLNQADIKKIYVIIRRDHLRTYGFSGISRQFNSEKFEWIVLDEPTKNQPETVANALRQKKILGPVTVKDCDNYFETSVPYFNAISVSSLEDHERITAANKSYVLTEDNFVTKIVEKKIISNTFCCGMYSFENRDQYLDVYDQLKCDDLYISHIVQKLINDGAKFEARPVKNYIDWGTWEDWRQYCDDFEVFFLDLDGVLVLNSSEYMRPTWGVTKGINENIEFIREKYNSGKVYIIITTSRKASYDKKTRDQLKRLDIPYHKIVYGLPHGKRCVINDYANSNPYPSCYAVSLPRNAPILRDLMR